MADWLWYCIEEFDREDLTLIFYGGKWVWYARNSLWHKDFVYGVTEAISGLRALAKEFVSQRFKFIVSREEAAHTWLASESEGLKINCDLAWDPKSKKACFGLVCKDYRGQVIFAKASCAEGLSNWLKAEGIALLKGFKEAQRRGLNKVTRASYNAEVFSVILDRGNRGIYAEEWKLGCQKRIDNFEGWNFEHVFREGNMTADALADYARKNG